MDMDATHDRTEPRRSRRLLGICGTNHVAHQSAMSLFQIPAGLPSERLGKRILLVGGTAPAGAAFVLAALSPGIPALRLMFALLRMNAGEVPAVALRATAT